MTGTSIALAVVGAGLQGAAIVWTAWQLFRLRSLRWPDDEPLYPRIRAAGVHIWRVPLIVVRWLARRPNRQIEKRSAEARLELKLTASAEAIVWPTEVDEQIDLLRRQISAIEERHAKAIKATAENMRQLEERVERDEHSWDADLKSQTRLGLGWPLAASALGTSLLVLAPLF